MDLLHDLGGFYYGKTQSKNIVFPWHMLLMDTAVKRQQTKTICNKGESFNPQENLDIWNPNQIGIKVGKGQNIEIPL